MQKIMHQKNDLIYTVEDKTFRIVELISEGGFSVVYKAEEIIGEDTCPVLLKAYSMDLSISERSEWESLIRHELQMNRKISKCGFAGALTMEYTVHEQMESRVYGVMPAEHQGKTLREYVDSDEWKHSTLRDRMIMGKRLFRLISNFHKKCGIIHGDINPNNIYLLDTDNDGVYERNAVFALLDFGMSQESEESAEAVLGYTEGYSRPDIVNGSRKRLLELDDWYAVLHCFWYCFTGRTVEEYPVTREHIEQMHNQLSVRYESVNFTNEEEKELLQMRDEHHKVVERLLGKIFLNMDILSEDVIDLVEQVQGILDDTGINRARMFSKLLEEYKSLRSTRFAGLDIVRRILPNAGFEMSKGTARFYRQKSNKPEPLQRIMKSCKDSLFMVGDGGMGKTTSLISIMDDTYGDDIDEGNPVIFMELCTLSQNYEEWYSTERGGTFVEQFIASYFTKEPRKYVAADHPYIGPLQEELFRSPQRGIRQYTLLLDGLNEIGFINDKSRKIFFEVLNHYIKYAKNLRIILTGRSDTFELSSESLLRIHTEGLDDIHIESILLEAVEKKSLSENDYHRIVLKRHEMISNEYRLWQCLRTPFFLMMYCMMSEKRAVTRQGEILKNFFHDKRETLDGKSIYGEKQQAQKKQQKKKYGDRHDLRMDLSIRIVLDFVVPEIACKMVMDNLFFIELKDVKQVIREYLKSDVLRETYQNWRKWFYGYEINVQEVLDEINRIDGGDRIPQYACEVLGIMRETANGTLFFTHQYFRDYFAACAFVNRMLLLLEAKGMGNVNLTAGDSMFENLIYPFHEKKLSPYIAALIGEILGECRNLPVYDAQMGLWSFPERTGQEQMVLSQLLDCYRLKRGMEWSYFSAMGLYNLFAIFKSSRVQNDGRVDLSGLSLRNLNLRNISLAGVVLSRFDRNGDSRLSADFENSSGALDAFLYDESITHMQCLAVHPAKKRILLRDIVNGTVTEADLEHGENILICEHMERISYASYCQKTDEILLVTYLPSTSEKKYKKSFMDKFLDVMRVSEDDPDDFDNDDFLDEDVFDYNDYDPRIFAGEEAQGAETRVYTFHKSTGLVLTAQMKGEKPAAAQWSEDFQELSIMLQNPIGEMELIKSSFSVRNGDYNQKLRSVEIDRRIFDHECLDMAVLGIDNFVFDRISKTEYVFTEFEAWNGDVGIWDIERNHVKSICYRNREADGGSLASICGCHKTGNVYALKSVEYRPIRSVRELEDIVFRQYKYKENELSGYPLKKSFALHKSKGNRIEFLQEQTMLCLSGNKLQMISFDKENTGWISNLYVQEYARSDAGYLIATCDDGLYEINILDGSTTCIQKFTKKRVSFVMGKTSNAESVILLESTGIIKWLDIHTGCCSRFATIQCPRFTRDFQIYADDANHTIIAVSGNRVSIWDAYSGVLLKTYTIELPKGEILLGKEIIEGDIVFYFEHRNYEKFPLEQLYYCKIWNVEKTEWEKGKLPPFLREYRKKPFRLYLSEDGFSIAIETVDETAKAKGMRWNKPSKRRIADMFLDPIRLEEYDEDEGFVRKQSEWKQSSWLQDKKRSILYQSVKGHQRKIEILESDEILLGITSQGVMYMKNNDADADIYVTNGYRQWQYGFGEVKGTIKNAFTMKDTLVMHVSDNNNTRSRILFWNMDDKNIYGYNATENLMITGCKAVTEPEPQAKNRKTLLEMQGLGNPVRHVIGKVRASEEERELVLNKLRERMKSWNVPALICCILLCVLSAVVLFGTEAMEAVREYWGTSYYVERFLRMLTSFFVLMMSTKVFLPYFMKMIKWEKFFGIGGMAVVAMFCAASAFMMSPALKVFWFRIDMLLMLWIPLAAWYSLNRPKRKIIWFMLMILMVVSFMYGTIPLNEYYSTTYLLQLVLTALASIMIAEFIRNRRSFWVGMAEVSIALSATGIMIWIFLKKHDVLAWRMSVAEDKLEHMVYWWGSLNNHCRQVLQHARWFGSANTKYLIAPAYGDAYAIDYVRRYFINFLIQEYGLVLGIASAVLSVIFVWTLIRGARRQLCKLDRSICMTCAVYFAIQLVITLPANFGLQWLPPYQIDFMNVVMGSWYTGILALSIYMAFYKAHKQMR